MRLTHFMRTILSYRVALVPARKNIMTTPRKLQEILDDLKGNPYYDKYAEKIAHLQKNAPEKFKSKVVDLEKAKNLEPDLSKERQFSQLLNPKKPIFQEQQIQAQQHPLDKIMKVDLIKDKTTEEIKQIWAEYHLKKEDTIAAIIPSEDFQKLQQNSKEYPTFLFPLPRSQGYEFIMVQFEKNTAHFTPLLYFQVHKDNAPECLAITHFTELSEDKGLVLMRGEYDKNIINAKEAQCLANQLQMFYVTPNESKLKLMKIFTEKADSFDHMDLIQEINNLSLN